MATISRLIVWANFIEPAVRSSKLRLMNCFLKSVLCVAEVLEYYVFSGEQDTLLSAITQKDKNHLKLYTLAAPFLLLCPVIKGTS